MSAECPKIARKARLRWDDRDAQYMLLYPERGLALNDTAAAIVKLCDGTRSVAQIIVELTALSGEPAAKVSSDVHEFLGRLAERKLLE